MELFAHQKETIEAIEDNFITSISAPRHSGKTVAAVRAAFQLGGKVLYVGRGNAAVAEAMQLALEWGGARTGDSIIHDDGIIHFKSYTKSGARGMVINAILFDDSDSIGADILAEYAPAVCAAKDPHIAAFGVAPDRGLAEHLHLSADKTLRWHGLDPESANPLHWAMERMFDRAEQALPRADYRREFLGLAEGEYDELVRSGIARVIAAQLDGQVLA